MDYQMEYVHTNIIARNWRKLAQFYIDVFGCVPVYPERDLAGEWIDRLTNLNGVRIRGIHLRLPGKASGPTLEIFEYNQQAGSTKPPAINNPGFGHIAFRVNDVQEVLERLLQHGGSEYGELVTRKIENLGTITVIYARDPEGNIIELQKWDNS
ncbi:MAG: VOC family protein [Bacteroidales bacterium]|nr:VOC family protein [Bacteroidales bacterium]